MDRYSLTICQCTWCKGADRMRLGKGLNSGDMTSSRATVRQQLQDASPLTGTVKQLSATLTQSLEETEDTHTKVIRCL